MIKFGKPAYWGLSQPKFHFAADSVESMEKIIVLIGAPGAGKGTQARLLQVRRGIPQISTGDMFREMRSAGTGLGREVQAIMAAGKLVSDDLTYKIVRERTARENGTYLLDGYPRTAVQAAQLEDLAIEQAKEVLAVEIDVPREELMKRLTGRRICPVCGEIYNVFSKPPKVQNFCDFHPEAKLNRRADDNETSVATRLAAFERDTEPLIGYFKESGRLVKICGQAGLEEIYRDLVAAIWPTKGEHRLALR